MRLSWRWLSEMADLRGTDPREAARLLALRTADVESVERVGGALDGVVTARVERVEPHPGADRLTLCTVSYGGPSSLRVVCGAPNVAEGQVVCFAPVGTALPNGITLKKAKIRGVESEGMICAEDEMGLGTAHEGIVVLPAGTPVGVPVSDVLGVSDTVLDVGNSGITNRPDLWGHVGFAREAAAVLGRTLRLPDSPHAEAALSKATGAPFPVEAGDGSDCRRYVALVVEGVVNGPSPERVRRRLAALSVRSVDLLVDLTTLAMLETGQPLHAFDLREVRGGAIAVRRARPGERMTFLDGRERALSPEDLVIADRERPLALAGVMGGAGSGVRADTTAIVLESACFDAARVRRSAIRHGLRTEASSRFEKSLDPAAAHAGAVRFLEALLAHAPKARVARALADAFPRPPAPVTIDLSFDLVRKRLGFAPDALPDDAIVGRLSSVGFSCSRAKGGARVKVPTWRAGKDVSIPEDLVEEVGRLHGYEHVVPAAPLAPMRPALVPPERLLERRGRTLLSLDLGYAEIASYVFHGEAERAALGAAADEGLRVTNPSSPEQDRLQVSCVQNLLRAAAKNQAREASLRLCEWTRVWRRDGGAGGAHVEVPVVGLLRAERDAADEPPGALFLALKEDALALLARIGGPYPHVRPGSGGGGAPVADGWAHPGRRTSPWVAGEVCAGIVAEVHPSAVRAAGLRGRVACAEIDLSRVRAAGPADPEYRPPPRFPTSTFDVSVIVPARTAAADVGHALKESAKDAVKDVRLFDAWAGKGIPEGHRSLAFTVEFGAEEGTLSPKALEALQRRAVQSLERRGWTVRTAEKKAPPP